MEVGFCDPHSDVVTHRKYFDFLNRYQAIGTGNREKGTSTVIISSEKELALEQLIRDLGEIPIISFEKKEYHPERENNI